MTLEIQKRIREIVAREVFSNPPIPAITQEENK
jgi:hypothetical protein